MLPRYSSFASLPNSKTQTCPCSLKRAGSTIDVDTMDEPLLAASTSSHTATHAGPGPSFTRRSSAHDSTLTPTITTASDSINRPPLPSSPHSAPLMLSPTSSTSHRTTHYPGGYYDNDAADASRMSFMNPAVASVHTSIASGSISPETNSLYERNTLFARLVAGEESEIGEAPPRYENVIRGTSSCGAAHLAGAHAMATIVAEHR